MRAATGRASGRAGAAFWAKRASRALALLLALAAGPARASEPVRVPEAAVLEADIERSLALGRFTEAMVLMEMQAAHHPEAANAPRWLGRAIELRIGFGMAKQAEADVARFQALYGQSAPEQAAAHFWALGALATTEAARFAHAEAYLRQHGHRGGLDRRLVAEARLAGIEWRRSCPVPGLDGLCVVAPAKPRRPSASRRCTPPSTPIPVARRRKAADAAQLRHANVASLARQPAEIPEAEPERRADYHEAIGLSRIAVLDREFEALLALRLPAGLSFYVDPMAEYRPRRRQTEAVNESVRRLQGFITDLFKRGHDLLAGYAAVAEARGSWRVRLLAGLRTAQLHAHFGDLLLSAEIPGTASVVARKVFCAEMRDQAAPHLDAARVAYSFCAVRAQTFLVTSDASDTCEVALTRMDPTKFPPLAEFVGEAPPQGVLAPRPVGAQLDAPPPPEALDSGGAVGEAGAPWAGGSSSEGSVRRAASASRSPGSGSGTGDTARTGGPSAM